LLQHVARLVTRLVVDYFDYTACPIASARRAARHAARRRLLHLRRTSGCIGTSRGLSRDSSWTTSSRGSSSTTSPRAGSSSTTLPTPCVRVPQHVARLVTRLVVDYFTYVARPVALARRMACRVACRVTHRRLLRLAQARRRLLRLRRASGCLGTSRGSSRHSSSTTSPTPRVRVPWHVARLVTRLVIFILQPHWIYFSHAVHRDYLSRGNTGSTSSTPRAATTSSSCRIASTIHLD
jgi:hypothetical protein